MRVKSTAVQFSGDKAYVNTHPFTGVVFFLDGYVVTRALNYENGKEVGEYVSQWLSLGDIKLSLDQEAFDDDYEPRVYRGQRFTGIIYDFDDDDCVGEALCENGRVLEEVSFYGGENVNLASYEKNSIDAMQEIRWFSNGVVREVSINKIDIGSITLKYDDSSCIESISVDGDYFGLMTEMKALLIFSEEDSLIRGSTTAIASRLFLSGLGLTDQFYNLFLSNSQGFNKVVLYRTALGVDNIKDICDKGASSIEIKDARSEVTSILDGLKEEYPVCIITLDD